MINAKRFNINQILNFFIQMILKELLNRSDQIIKKFVYNM